ACSIRELLISEDLLPLPPLEQKRQNTRWRQVENPKAKDKLIQLAKDATSRAASPSPPPPSPPPSTSPTDHDLPDPASDFPDPTSDLLDPASDLPDPAFDNGRATIFNRAQTLMILQLYLERKHKFGSVVYKKKTLWFEITEKLNTHFKTTFTAGQVEGRWKTQLAAYRQYKDDQNKSGNSRKEFPDEAEFTEILGDRHDLEPAYKLQSMPAKESVGSQNSSGLNICDLPVEILIKILSYVPIPDIITSISNVCKLLQELVESGAVFSVFKYSDIFEDGMLDC
ncbi:uncharacterized protein LOC117319180, partial [Pecten maximus]|uniref:uncharacterized protein LOC117319180 n=1 Tax=Pecten maximus TaxID=6579 RepID=UPI0014590921